MFMDAMKDLVGQSIDLGEWFQWSVSTYVLGQSRLTGPTNRYTFDTIGNITFSQTFDFVKNRGDRLDIINGIAAGDLYQTVVSQFPGLHQWLLGNPTLVNTLMKIPAMAKANPFITLEKVFLRQPIPKFSADSFRRWRSRQCKRQDDWILRLIEATLSTF